MDVLSLWRSPLDQVALSEAHRLSARQPLCTSVPFNQAFNLMTIYRITDVTLTCPADSNSQQHRVGQHVFRYGYRFAIGGPLLFRRRIPGDETQMGRALRFPTSVTSYWVRWGRR